MTYDQLNAMSLPHLLELEQGAAHPQERSRAHEAACARIGELNGSAWSLMGKLERALVGRLLARGEGTDLVAA